MTTPDLHPTPNDPGVGKHATITRIFDAPRELVDDVWTDERHFASWFAPRHVTNPVVKLDARPVGAFPGVGGPILLEDHTTVTGCAGRTTGAIA